MRTRLFLPLAGLAVVACQDQPPTSPPPGSPSASISDGANLGNPHFFWLPPMVKQPTTSGVPNAGLSPTLEICDGVDALTGECTTVVVAYTTTSGPGGEMIRTDAAQHYQVNVHTDVIGLVAGVTYRWRLVVEGFELGHADILMTATGGEAKNVTNDELIGLVDGRTLPTNFRIEDGALAAACAADDECGGGTVTPEGGGTVTVQTSPGVDVAGAIIPAGAVNQETDIFIRRIDQTPCLPTGRKQVPGCYEFIADPPVADFNATVLVGVCIDVTGLTLEEIERGRLYKFDEGDPNVRELDQAVENFLDCDGFNTASAGSNALSRFAKAGWRVVQRHFSPWFSPQPAMAIDLGRGGEVGPGDGGFSTIGWAVERVLIYGPSMSLSTTSLPENEQTLAADSGLGVTVASAATWAGLTAGGIDGFGDYDALVFGDPTCATSASLLGTADANKLVWSPVAIGPTLVIGTDPQFHQSDAAPKGDQAKLLIRNGLMHATSGTETGLYVSLSCYHFSATAATALTFLSAVGTFQVIGQGNDPQTVTIVAPLHLVMTGLSSAGLSNWGNSVHEFFPTLTSFPADFTVLAEGTFVTATASQTLPYIIARP